MGVPLGWSFQDPRDEIQGGQWRGVVGGVHFAGEALAGYGGRLVAPEGRDTGDTGDSRDGRNILNIIEVHWKGSWK